MMRIGIDFGGTKIKGVLLDKDNRQVKHEQVPSEAAGGYEKVLGNIKLVYDRPP